MFQEGPRHAEVDSRPLSCLFNGSIIALDSLPSESAREKERLTDKSAREQELKTIVVDGLPAAHGGGWTYLLQLLNNIPDDWAGKYRVVVILPSDFSDRFEPDAAVEILTPRFPARSLVHRVLWYWTRLPSLMKSLRADVLFCPWGTLATRRLGGAKSAVAHQNMLPFDPVERERYPYSYLRGKLWLLRWTQGASFRDADLVIFISEYGKRVIDRCVPRRRGRSLIVPHGLSDHFRQRTTSIPEAIKGVEYVLYVSIQDYYKAQLEVVSAWASLRQRRTTPEKLVLAGPVRSPSYGRKVGELVHSLGLQDEVLLTGDVPYENLPAYYQNAKVNLFASSCENCPNILLEAMAGGRPVLCSNYPPMQEFAGEAAAYFDPYNPGQLADLLARFLDDEPLRARMGTAASQRSQRYQWRDSAHRTWLALAELAG